MTNPNLDDVVQDIKKELDGNFSCRVLQADVQTILTALSSLQAECDKLREDKKMLDWLGTSKCHALSTFTEEEISNMSELMPTDINSFREAIRNAMKGTQ